MENRWGKGKGDGKERGGEVRIQPTRVQSGRESHHDAKEGFQVSKKEIQEQGVGISRQRGGYQKDWACTSDIMLILYISC